MYTNWQQREFIPREVAANYIRYDGVRARPTRAIGTRIAISFVIAAVFFSPFMSLRYDAGLGIDAGHVFATIAVLALIAFPMRRTSLSASDFFLLAFVFYCLAETALQSFNLPSPVNGSSDLFRSSSLRWVAQLAMLIVSVASYYVVRAISANTNARVTRTIASSIFVLCCLGFLQEGLYVAGVSIGVVNVQSGVVSVPVIRIGQLAVLRMSSLAGEPKTFAAVLLPALFMCVAYLLQKARSRMRRLCVFTAALCVPCLLATLSTGGFYALGLSLLPCAVVLRRHLRPLDHRVLAALFVILGATVIIAPVLNYNWLVTLFHERVTDRVDAIDYPEASTLAFLRDHPERAVIGVGYGNIGLYAHEYLVVENTNPYLRNNVLPLASWGLRLLAETGVVGVLLFLGFQLALITEARRRMRRCLPSAELVPLLAAAVCIICIQPFNFSNLQWPVLGALSGYASRKQQTPAIQGPRLQKELGF